MTSSLADPVARSRPARLRPAARTGTPADAPRRAPWSFARLVRTRWLGWSAVAAAVVVWQWRATVAPTPVLPAPTAVAERLALQWTTGGLPSALGYTLRAMAVGFLLAAVVGVVVGVVMARVRVVDALLEPVIELLRPVPTSALLPLLILYLGIGPQMQVAAVVISAVFPVVINSYAGARAVPLSMHDTARTFGLTWLQTQRQVVLPAAVPQIFVGLRTGVTISLIMSVVIGMLAGNGGIGLFILQAQQDLDVRSMFAGIVTIAAVGYLLNLLFVLVERRVLHWHASAATRAS